MRLFLTCLLISGCVISQPSLGENRFSQIPGNAIDFPVTIIDSPIVDRQAVGDTIYTTNFNPVIDIDEDMWPDNWGEYYGPGYPRYMKKQIVSKRTPFGTGCLQIPILRGGAIVFTPRIEVLRGLTYTGNAHVLSQGLYHNHVLLSLSLLDRDGHVLQTTFSESVINSNGWTLLTTASLLADHPEGHAIAMGVHVIPTGRQDLSGMVEIGQVSISEQPTIQFTSPNPWQLYASGKDVEISGRITASWTSWSKAKLEIRDAYGNVLESRPVAKPEYERPLPKMIEHPFGQSSLSAGDQTVENKPVQEPSRISQYEFHWTPTTTAPGYYSVTLSLPMPGIDPYTLEPRGASQSFSFVNITPNTVSSAGNFGWSLPVNMSIDDCTALKPLLDQAGISLLKYPVWLDAGTSETTWQKHSRFCEWLVGKNIRGIGVLSEPPKNVLAAWQREFQLTRHGIPIAAMPRTRTTEHQISAGTDTIAKSTIEEITPPNKPEVDIGMSGNIFNLPQEKWLPSIETTIFRLGMVLSGWQLGHDRDMSLTGFDNLEQILETLDSHLNERGLDTPIGLPWDWVYPFPQGENDGNSSNSSTTYGFLSLDNEWPLTADDLGYYLSATDDANIMRFVQIDLLDKRRYSLEERIRDLVRRLVTAQEHGATAVFLSRPFDENYGVFSLSGEPAELFLPWRTCASMMSGRQALGHFNMPGGSENHLFRGSNETIMVVWNATPTDETLFLGNGCQIINVWGQETVPGADNYRQSLTVGPMPVFVRNINHDVAMIRQNCRLENSDIPSRYGESIANKLYFTNTTDKPLSGQLIIDAPTGVEVRPNKILLNLMDGETLEQDLEITFNAQATSGPQMILVRADTTLQEARIFDIYHPINIGGGDISIDFSTRLNRNNELEVQQAFINDGQEIADFTCTLYIPNRPLQKMQIRNQGFGRSDYTYVIPNARSLIGKKLRIVAKDNMSRRTLKYEIDIEP